MLKDGKFTSALVEESLNDLLQEPLVHICLDWPVETEFFIEVTIARLEEQK